MEKLTKYLSFIRENYLQEVAKDNLRNAIEMNLPIMRMVEGIPEDILLEQGQKSIRDFADQLADGTYVEKQAESLRKWENDELPELKQHSIEPEDLVLIYPLQRKMFYNFLPRYTGDTQLAMDILQELDSLQTKSQIDALRVLMRKQRQTEERVQFQSYLLDNATDAIITTDISKSITYSNKACEKIFGYSTEDLLGKISSEAFKVDPKSEKVGKNTASTLEKTGNSEAEIIYLTKTGEPVPVLISASEMKDKNGARAGYFVIFKDIRERIKHEQQIEQTNNFLNAILENIPNMVFVKDAKDFRFVRFNKAGEELLGYSKADLIGKNDYDFFPKEQADFFTAKDQEVLDQGKLLDIKEEPVNTLHKGERWLHTKKLPVIGEDGKPIFLMGISEDITEQKQIEKSLRESEERFRLLIENVQDYAIFMIDPDGNILSWNLGAERVKGYKAEEVIGKNISMFYTPEAIANGELKRNLSEAKQKGSYESEGWKIRKNGERFWADVIFTVLHNDAGELTGFSKITRDITERKKHEEAFMQLNKELEAFTYSVSHDLRAPLRAVSGYSNMLQEDFEKDLGNEGKRLIDVIKYNAEKMGRLIDDLLAFSRLGRKEIIKTRENMQDLVDGVLIELNKTMPHNAEIKIGKMLKAKVDYGLMHQVMLNLVSNAVKYSSKKEKPVVEICSERNGKEIIYSVKDNGVGFDMKYAAKLFGVFQRLHSMEEFEGTGVGLAIVQRVIAKHHGRVWAEGKVNGGATFYIALPDE
jgi:PAS domain S-box-containing protein